MNLAIMLIITIIFFYTIGFSRVLWKEQNKFGATVVLILALTIIILPFFTVLK